MLPITRLGFNKMLMEKRDLYGDPYNDPKTDMDSPSIKVGKVEM